ncbi:MAG: GWxTD domain-containing protein [candidate division WOR-3 bacterium]|nr:MAG: GWxTD domain-containing protein [candidate division WOR-3 bacterium]
MNIVFVSLIFSTSLAVDCYRFEGGYVEVWYQIPAQSFLAAEELTSTQTVTKEFSFHLSIYNEETADSANIEGRQRVHITDRQQDDFIINSFPVHLYPGRFYYIFKITSEDNNWFSDGHIEIPLDTLLFTSGDIVLGKKRAESEFRFRDVSFVPSLHLEFTRYDALFSYLEIYGFIPDSLSYNVCYTIRDSQGNVVFENRDKRLKYAYNQLDTFALNLGSLEEGDYTFSIEILDPAVEQTINRTKNFKIIQPPADIARMKYYSAIHYIVTPGEYRTFQRLTESEKKAYLKDFWSERDYWQFEERLREADAQFSTGTLNGRDSERGKYYIRNGPPDDVEIVPMAGVARPFEVWHYYSAGHDILFSDIKDDGNSRLVKIFEPGELIEILERGFREGDVDEDWLFDIAPGTYPTMEKPEEEGPEVIDE